MAVDLSYVEDCLRIRPNWSPEDGVASSFNEFFLTMNEPLGFAWLAILFLFLWKRNILFGSLLPLFSLALFVDWNLAKYNLNDDLYYGQLGGCIGSLAFANFVLLAASLAGVTIVFMRWRGRA